MNQPVCFVIMSFGKKSYVPKNSPPGAAPKEIDYDVIYQQLIVPAIHAADMEPVRADHEQLGGIIHKPMFERILLSEYVLADLTGLNANVFYELGIRHAYRPYTTVNIYASDSTLPFDTNALRTLPYNTEAPDEPIMMNTIAQALLAAKNNKTVDSPVFQLVNGLRFQNSVAHEKTDIFREQIVYNQEIAAKLAIARKLPQADRVKAIDAVQAPPMKIENEETGVLIDIMLSYRAVGAWDKMIDFVEKMPPHVQATVMVQEQYALALNRSKRRDEAKKILNALIDQYPPSSETFGILGRVYKDEFDEFDAPRGPVAKRNDLRARASLEMAINTYRLGFEADWRDFYPGINLVTLLAVAGKYDEVYRILPVVEFAARQKVLRRGRKAEYWDHATLVELEVVKQNRNAARENLVNALACEIEDAWMFDTTIKNLELLRRYRSKRDEPVYTEDCIIAELKQQRELYTESHPAQ